MRVLLTGALGLIGLETIKALRAYNFSVIACDWHSVFAKRTNRAHFNEAYVSNLYKTLAECDDLIEPENIESGLSKADTLIHLGALVDTMADPEDLMKMNLEETKRIMSLTQPSMRVIFASSAACAGNSGFPLNPYGMSKQLGERVMRYHPAAISLRFFNVYGAFEHHKGMMASMPFKIVRSYVKGDSFDLFNINSSRDFIAAVDVARCIALLTNGGGSTSKVWHKQSPREFDLGTGKSVTFDTLDDLCKRTTGSLVSRAKIVEQLTAVNGQYQVFTRAGDNRPNVMAELNVVPKQIEDGVKELFEALK